MTRKCLGCGISLQSSNVNELGYVRKEKIDDSIYCENCFKLIHYGKKIEATKNIDVDKFINNINKTNYPVLFVIDVLNLTNEVNKYLDLINNKKYILLTKFDLLPKGVKEGKLVKYFKKHFANVEEVYSISGVNNYNVDKIFGLLKNKKYKNVFVAGFTNAGKSTLINSFASSKGMPSIITTSAIPNTTLECINTTIDGINFIDMPGFVYAESLYNILSEKDLLNIAPKNELKVKTFQMHDGEVIIIKDLVRIEYSGDLNSFNFYMNNNLEYKKCKIKNNNELTNLDNIIINLTGKQDIVISGLGFIKVNKPGTVKVYIKNKNVVSVRIKMI